METLIGEATTLAELQSYGTETIAIYERYPKLEEPFSDTPAAIRAALGATPPFEVHNDDGSIDQFGSARLSLKSAIVILPSIARIRCG